MLETISIKVPKAKKARLRALAAARRTTLSGLISAAVDRVIEDGKSFEAASCHDLVREIFEKPERLDASGKGDLSTNKARLAGFGRKKA